MQLAVITFTWTIVNQFFFWLCSMFFYTVFLLIYNGMLQFDPSFYDTAGTMTKLVGFWWLLLLIPAATVICDVAVEYARVTWFPE
jgi:hypothetical protein